MWTIVGRPYEVQPEGYDGAAVLWDVAPSGGGAAVPVVVKFPGRILATSPHNMSTRVAEAVGSCGRTEVERVLRWAIPPRAIEMRLRGEEPVLALRDPAALAA